MITRLAKTTKANGIIFSKCIIGICNYVINAKFKLNDSFSCYYLSNVPKSNWETPYPSFFTSYSREVAIPTKTGIPLQYWAEQMRQQLRKGRPSHPCGRALVCCRRLCSFCCCGGFWRSFCSGIVCGLCSCCWGGVAGRFRFWFHQWFLGSPCKISRVLGFLRFQSHVLK